MSILTQQIAEPGVGGGRAIGASLPHGAFYAVMQTFKADGIYDGGDTIIRKVSLRLKLSNSEQLPGIYRVSIRATDEESPAKPLLGAENDLWYEDFNSVTTLTTDYQWIEFESDLNLPLGEDVKYGIVVRLYSYDDAPEVNRIYWDGTSDPHDGVSGISWNNAESGWDVPVYDRNFIIEGVPVAKNPTPEDGGTDINRVTDLEWEAGESAVDNYDVYFGPAGGVVLVASRLHANKFSIQDYLNEGAEPEDPTIFLDTDTEYFWKVDSYIGDASVAPGTVWSYTTRAQRSVVLLSPDNFITEQLVGLPITWEIDGIGAQYGSFQDQDYLFVYIRADDANFTEDDLVGNFVEAVNNDSLFISQLKYSTTYFWQVQGANTSDDLSDSEVWEFSTVDFYPPAPSFDSGLGYITGRSNMVTVKRVIAAANNKIWYEEDNG